jgi:hypothetical protein
MATRTRTSFQKRQKELARVEKQRDKAAKRLQRKLEGPKPEEPEDMLLDSRIVDEDGEPVGPSAQTQSEPPTQQEESH